MDTNRLRRTSGYVTQDQQDYSHHLQLKKNKIKEIDSKIDSALLVDEGALVGLYCKFKNWW